MVPYALVLVGRSLNFANDKTDYSVGVRDFWPKCRQFAVAAAGRANEYRRVVIDNSSNPAYIDAALDSRAITFENPTGARGAGGSSFGGRKGSPSREISPGERVTLADIEGPGIIRHIWMTFLPGSPAQMRGQYLEVFYGDATEPSISVPCLDFFGMPHGRPVAYASAFASAHEARGFNSYLPMPFHSNVRVEYVNGSTKRATLYYQIDYTLQTALPAELGQLHVSFRRENPTVMRRDFVIVDGFSGAGRFFGCNVGVRLIDECMWYGEGEVKVYRDGDTDLPTICGTGLEDYVGTAWGMGAHAMPYGGAPLVVQAERTGDAGRSPTPDFVGFYRWHALDPIVFATDLRVTIQQIGAAAFQAGEEDRLDAYSRTNPPAGRGWIRDVGGLLAWGIAERVDDYCATAFVYCRDVQPVPRLDIAAATADIESLPYEKPLRFTLG
jgi:hypothetical protein